MTSMTPLLTRIREKVIEVNPEISVLQLACLLDDCTERECRFCEYEDRTIRLADILLAIAWCGKKYEIKPGLNVGIVYLAWEQTFVPWDLRHDLGKQSPECWEFLGEILGV